MAPPFGLAEVVQFSLRPVAPASEVGANAVVCLTGTAELGVYVAGPSLPVCPCVTTMVVLWCCYWLILTIHVSQCIYIFDVNELLQLMLQSQPRTK